MTSGSTLTATSTLPVQRIEGTPRPRWAVVLLLIAVGVAFADSSIVTLAVPEILVDLDATLESGAWVVTSFNVALAVAALPALLVLRRIGARAATAVGVGIFLVASIGGAVAGSLSMLVAVRSVQGLGAALLLVGALPVLATLTGSRLRGLAAWSGAAALGAAAGPALGGVLTEVFDWRAVFLAQAPLAAGAALVLAQRTLWPTRAGGDSLSDVRAGPGTELALQGDTAAQDPPMPGARTAHVALALVSGALVGALFLVVVLMVTSWGVSPLQAAVVASALPVGTLAVGPLVTRLRSRAAVAGAVVVAASLIALAAVPGGSELLAAAGLALAGAGLGLAVPSLTLASISVGPRQATDGAWSTAARHAGLVLALLALTPLLTADLESIDDEASLWATAAILDSPIDLGDKIDLARGLADTVNQASGAEVPDLAPAVAAVGEGDDFDSLRADLQGILADAITGAFRRAFLLCALLAAAAAVAALVVILQRRAATTAPGRSAAAPSPSTPAWAWAATGGLVVAAGIVAVAGVAAGSLEEDELADPCAPSSGSDSGGFDGFMQTVLLDTVTGAACDLDTSRELLVLSLLPDEGQPRIPLDEEQLEPAVRAGFDRALDRYDDGLSGLAVSAVRPLIDAAPVDWLVGALLDPDSISGPLEGLLGLFD